MVCKNCGAQLSIEDVKCPFCGRKNTEAVKHTAQMHHYNQEFSKEKRKVLNMTFDLKSTIALVIIIAVLSVANVAVLFMKENIFDIRRYVQERALAINEEKNKKILSSLEEEENYSALSAYYKNERIYYYTDKNHEFRAVADIGGYYDTLLYDILYCQREEVADDMKGFAISESGGVLKNMYDCFLKTQDRYEEECYTEAHQAALDKMQAMTEGLLMVYGNFTEKDIERLRNGATAEEISSFIGRRLSIYE